MPRNTFRVAVLVCAIAIASQAAGQDAQQVVQRAIDARGGAAALDKFPVATVNVSGTVSASGMMIPFTGTEAWELPKSFATELNMSVSGQKIKTVQTIINGRVSQTVNGRAISLPEKLKSELRELARAHEMERLTPLLNPERYQLTLEPDATVGKFQTNVVRISSKGMEDLTLYFDKDSGLPVKAMRNSLKADVKPVLFETFYSDYRQQQGVLWSMYQKMLQDGKTVMTVKASDLKFFEKLDDEALARGN